MARTKYKRPPLLYRMAPQMAYYHSAPMVQRTWVPFVMFHSGTPGASTPVCSFDSYGMRHGHSADGQVVSLETCVEGRHVDQTIDILVGSSTAVGVGASGNRFAVASRLSDMSSRPVVNLSARAWSIQQNTVHFLFVRNMIPPHQRIGRAIVMIGYNELSVFLRNMVSFRSYGQFGNMTEFFQKANQELLNQVKTGAATADSIDAFFVRTPQPVQARKLFLDSLAASLENWLMFGKAGGFDVHLFLQPVLNWSRRKHSREEEALMAEHALLEPSQYKLSADCAAAYHAWFAASLRETAARLNMRFTDLNDDFSDADGRWLFLDPFHLTDEGQELTADKICQHLR